MANTRLVGFVHGTCARCQETTMPLTFYKRTKEWLCDPDLATAKLEIPTQEALKKFEKKTDDWNRATSRIPVSSGVVIDT